MYIRMHVNVWDTERRGRGLGGRVRAGVQLSGPCSNFHF